MYGTHKCMYHWNRGAQLTDVYSVDTFVMWPVIVVTESWRIENGAQPVSVVYSSFQRCMLCGSSFTSLVLFYSGWRYSFFSVLTHAYTGVRGKVAGLVPMLRKTHGTKVSSGDPLRGQLWNTVSSFRAQKLPQVDHQRVANTSNDLQVIFLLYLFAFVCKKRLGFCCSHQVSVLSAMSAGYYKMVNVRRMGVHQLSN